MTKDYSRAGAWFSIYFFMFVLKQEKRDTEKMKTVEEIKINKNKETQRFTCVLLEKGPGRMVLGYYARKAGTIADIAIPPGSTTIAHYWSDRGYVMWRMFDAALDLIGTLFHICRNVAFSSDSVSYEDLIIDIWVSPQGHCRLLDEDELVQTAAKGCISDAEQEWIARWRSAVIEQHDAAIMEAAAGESALLALVQQNGLQ